MSDLDKKRYLLGLDDGGTEAKCAIFDLEGHEISAASRRLETAVPFPGWSERDAESVWEANAAVIREALEQGGVSGDEIMAVGMTGYGNGVCFVDADGRPTYPCVVSVDDRAASYCGKFAANGAERANYPLTCQTIWSGQPAALLPWFKDNRPEVLEKSRWCLSIKDFLRFHLTGDFVSEVTDASSGCLFNLHTKQYDLRLFKNLGIEDCLRLMPPCVESTAVTGHVTEKAAAETGLAAGTPVAGGYFDIDAGALASGMLDGDTLCIIMGTWSVNEYLSPSANTDYDLRHNTVTLSYYPGHYLIEDSSPTGASNFDWYVRTFVEREGLSPKEAYRQCDELLERTDPFDNGVIFVPYLFGSATCPDARGAFLNLTNYNDRAHVLQAVYEGVAFSTKLHVKNLRRPVSDYRCAKLSGGIVKSRAWVQMMADVLGMPVEAQAGSQLTAKGAAMGAGVACGYFASLEDAAERMVQPGERYDPRPEYAAHYEKKYRAYERALAALELFHTPADGER